MKKFLLTSFAVLICGVPVLAQMGGPGGNFDNGMDKLFGDNQVFSATMQTEITGPNGSISAKAKMYFNHGNSRTEMNMTDVRSANLPTGVIARMQAAGMDKTVLISSADKKNNFLIYPTLQSYTVVPMPGAATATNENFKVETAKLGDETVDGHPCVKNNTIVTDAAGQAHQFIAWNASDLKNFPVKISMTVQGTLMTVSFQNVSFEKPDDGLFQPPPNFTRYESIQALQQQAILKNAGNPATAPPVQ